jgi:hypothetical protein
MTLGSVLSAVASRAQIHPEWNEGFGTNGSEEPLPFSVGTPPILSLFTPAFFAGLE